MYREPAVTEIKSADELTVSEGRRRRFPVAGKRTARLWSDRRFFEQNGLSASATPQGGSLQSAADLLRSALHL